MSRYEKYKPTNIEWIGEIPEHWQVKKLKYIGEAIIGITYSPDDISDEENGLLVLRSSNIQDGKLAFEDCVYVSKDVKEKHLTKEGDVLLCARNGSAHLVGKSALIRKEHINITWGAFMSIFRSSIGEFAYQFFNSQIFKSQTGLFATSTINQLTTDTLNNLFVPLPLPQEQTVIAKYLDEKATQIDKLIANKQQLIELLKEERTAMINNAVSGEGKNWARKKLKYVAKKVQTGSTPPSNEENYYTEEINWFTPSDFSDNLLLKNSRRKISQSAIVDGVVKLFPAYSVLFVGIGATLGKVGYIIEPATSNQQINCLSFSSEEEAFFYANYFFSNQPNIVALANAATLAILNQSQMKDIIVPVPINKMVLQDCISKIQNETGRIDSTISKIEREIDLIQEYKKALISEVVTGKQKVTN